MSSLIDKITSSFLLNITNQIPIDQNYLIFLFVNNCHADHIKDRVIKDWVEKYNINILCKLDSSGKLIENEDYELTIFSTKDPKEVIYPIVELYQGFNLNNIDYSEDINVKLMYFNIDDDIEELKKWFYYKDFLVSESILQKFSQEEISRIKTISSSKLMDYIVFFYDTSVKEEVKLAFSTKVSDPIFIIKESSQMLMIREFPNLIDKFSEILDRYKHKINFETAFDFFNGVNDEIYDPNIYEDKLSSVLLKVDLIEADLRQLKREIKKDMYLKDDEINDAKYVMSEVICTILSKFRSLNPPPPDGVTENDWEKILWKIISTHSSICGEGRCRGQYMTDEEISEGLDLFRKYYLDFFIEGN